MKKSLSKAIKLNFLVLLGCLIFSACNGTEESGSNLSKINGLENNELENNGLESSGLLGGSPVENAEEGNASEDENNGDMLQAAGGEGYGGYLGYGYNIITGPYYNRDGINHSHPVIDTDNPELNKLITRVDKNNNKADGETMVADSAKEYTERLAMKAGIKAGFGFTGSLEANFESNYSSQINTNQRFITTHVLLEKEREYILYVDAGLLADYVTEGFKRDVSKLTPEKLIERYGTHVLTDITLGGRFDINYFYTSTLSTVTSSIEVSAEASYRNISGTAQTNDEKTSKELDTNSKFKALTYGGSLTVDPSSPKEAIASYNKWSTAVEQGNLAFINATNNIPIWEVVANLTDVENYMQKSKDIEESYKKIIAETANGFKDPVYAPLYISELHVGYGKKESSAKSMLFSKGVSESNILDLDLNKNVGGNWIYLGYKTTYNREEAITDIAADYYSKSRSSDLTYKGIKYTIIPDDLSKDAGGKFIYLYYTKDQSAGNPVTSIQYLHEKTWQYGHGNGYIPVKPLGSYEALDINKDAGGDYIWLYFKRE